jgi:hypothetical protein
VRALYARDAGFPDRGQGAPEVLGEVYAAVHDRDEVEDLQAGPLWETWCERN